jgi:hypothetical protein
MHCLSRSILRGLRGARIKIGRSDFQCLRRFGAAISTCAGRFNSSSGPGGCDLEGFPEVLRKIRVMCKLTSVFRPCHRSKAKDMHREKPKKAKDMHREKPKTKAKDTHRESQRHASRGSIHATRSREEPGLRSAEAVFSAYRSSVP